MISKGFFASTVGGFDTEALAYINRMITAGANPDGTERDAINAFFVNFKSLEGLSSITDALDWLVIHGIFDQDAAVLDITSNEFNHTEVNTPTWATTGYTGNGSSMYLDTGFSPAADGIQFTQNSASMGVYNRTAGNDAAAEIGSTDGANNGGSIICRFTDNNTYYRANHGGGSNAVASIDPQGLISWRRTGAGAIEAFRNGASIDTDTDASSSLNGVDVFVLANNANGTPGQHTSREVAASFMGNGSFSHLNLYNELQTLLTVFGSNI